MTSFTSAPIFTSPLVAGAGVRLPPGLALGLGLLLAATGCGVGEGVGSVDGTLYVSQCSSSGDYGTFREPAAYQLDPDFFVGEPIEDVRPDGIDNRIVIRVETVGRRVRQERGVIDRGPLKDQLTFDIDVYPVARCVRAVALGSVDEDMLRFCQISPDDQLPRVRVGPEQPIRVNFVARATCPSNGYVIGTARGDDPRPGGVRSPLPPANWNSFVKFRDFGKAGQRDIDPTFKVEFGHRLRVESFSLEIEDDKVLKAEQDERLAPVGELRAHLGGRFDFDLDRGQGAQTFP